MVQRYPYAIIFIMLFSINNLYSKKQSGQTNKRSADHGYKGNMASFDIPHGSITDRFIFEFLKKYPKTACLCGMSVIPSVLYSNEINEFIQNNRLYFGVAGSVVGLLAGVFGARLVAAAADEEELQEGSSERGSLLSELRRSGVRVYMPGDIDVEFDDVIGLESAKEDLQDILNFLIDSAPFIAMGAKIPKGALLYGHPGTGKTLLARALAGEAECPFLYISATEFIEAVVGVGAARIRDLFKLARDLAPCIIFIDEIDAIAKKRNAHSYSGDSELIQTLNQLLVEMDGFEQRESPIVVIGATNRLDVLDEAVLRPGRFDRKVHIERPRIHDRFDMLQYYLSNVEHDQSIDLHTVALATTRFTGADLAALINEAALLAVRDHSLKVCMSHIDEAYDYMLLGRETKGLDISQEEYWTTAVHEAGHALARVLQDDAIPLYKVTITPRGQALGLTWGVEEKERYSQYYQEMIAELVVALAGSVAEELVLAQRGVGAHNDLQKVRALAEQIVMDFGMIDEFKDITFSEYKSVQYHLAPVIAEKIQNAVHSLIFDCRKKTEQLLKDHQSDLLAVAQLLVEKRTISGADVYRLCNRALPNIVFHF